ncbi:HrcA family transcriptional regulator [Nitratiruptor sp. SB155-2]|uniref:HrcA family transcriptional regulator n=1 Tax=Nitratiruptor sp. (strain SB155-2) TaxID=387092 RepID=UPI0001586FD4|nr:HrcA family transcriptional regulator [Nitratiruptor sp. SB155-2]BAF70232.1 heat-inducible transcription repressor HrcA [Nitratiruptor sp. SB155-2]
MDKKEIVLEGVIEEYIDKHVPVSSKTLQERLSITISSATIRYYFKQLTEQGYLQKEHVSSGRIPTAMSLKRFWQNRLEKKYIRLRDRETLKNIQNDEIFCEYLIYENIHLRSIENYKNRYIVAIFDNEKEYLIPYNEKLEEFLANHIDLDLESLSKLLNEVGLIGLASELKKFAKEDFHIYNMRELLAIAKEHDAWAKTDLPKIMSGEKLVRQKPGIMFHDNFLAYKFYIDIDEHKKGEMLLMGHLFRNFQQFIQKLH